MQFHYRVWFFHFFTLHIINSSVFCFSSANLYITFRTNVKTLKKVTKIVKTRPLRDGKEGGNCFTFIRFAFKFFLANWRDDEKFSKRMNCASVWAKSKNFPWTIVNYSFYSFRDVKPLSNLKMIHEIKKSTWNIASRGDTTANMLVFSMNFLLAALR